jgi:hypothetical protein
MEQEAPETGFIFNGSPICNYAAEMSPLDPGFRDRIEDLYARWRGAIADALGRGQKAGKVRDGIKPAEEAAFLVSSMEGIAATGKTTRDLSYFQGCYRAAERYIESLRP